MFLTLTWLPGVHWSLMSVECFRTHKDNLMFVCKDIGRLPPVFADASVVSQEILDSGYEYDHGSLYFNKFKYASLYFSFRV